jgi:hypothetical protein
MACIKRIHTYMYLVQDFFDWYNIMKEIMTKNVVSRALISTFRQNEILVFDSLLRIFENLYIIDEKCTFTEVLRM